MYKNISIYNGKIAGADQKCHIYLAKCETLEFHLCKFGNIGDLAHMISNCKSLKILNLDRFENSSGLEGLEAVESCVNINAINLNLTILYNSLEVLQLFKIIQLDIRVLNIDINYWLRNVENL
jgi:hypothetical protein